MRMADRGSISRPAVDVVRHMASEPDVSKYGFELSRELRIPSGTLYPLLGRLCRRGWLLRESEAGDPSELGRPVRTYYRLTEEGRRAAEMVDDDLMAIGARRGWSPDSTDYLQKVARALDGWSDIDHQTFLRDAITRVEAMDALRANKIEEVRLRGESHPRMV
jgi:PadR family transcriptional regulator, regulatory protein PadR